MFGGPHGAVCAALLPACLEANERAMRRRQPDADILDRYDEIARMLTADPRASAEEGIEWIRRLCASLAVPPLKAYGVTRADFGPIIEKSMRASSMKSNPIALLPNELEEILAASLG